MGMGGGYSLYRPDLQATVDNTPVTKRINRQPSGALSEMNCRAESADYPIAAFTKHGRRRALGHRLRHGLWASKCPDQSRASDHWAIGFPLGHVSVMIANAILSCDSPHVRSVISPVLVGEVNVQVEGV